MTPNYGRGRVRPCAACFLDQFTLLIDCVFLLGWRNQGKALSFLLRLTHSGVPLHKRKSITERNVGQNSCASKQRNFCEAFLVTVNFFMSLWCAFSAHSTLEPSAERRSPLTKHRLFERCNGDVECRKQFVVRERKGYSSGSPVKSRTGQGLCKMPIESK